MTTEVIMTGTDHEVGPQLESGKHVDSGIPYTFSSSSLRKKKNGKKKLRNKKIITEEEAKTKMRAKTKMLSRSLSTSALLSPNSSEKEKSASTKNATWNMAPKPKTPSPALATLLIAPAASKSPIKSPIGSDHNAQPEGRQEHKIDLTASARLKNIRKPWETDIQKKCKTEFGDRILREGPSSDDPSIKNRLATNQRSRSLSVSRHKSPSARRLLFNRHSSSSSLSDSDEDPSSVDEANGKQDSSDEIPCIVDGDNTYEKYRQFLASSKKSENDETMTRQSVMLLKKKVGAAPTLNFSYRYSAAADELLGIGNGNDYDNCGGDTCEKEAIATDPITDISQSDLPVTDTELATEQTAFLGEVFNDVDANNDKNEDNNDVVDSGESRCDLQESFPVLNQEENLSTTSVSTPIPISPLPVSSPHSPSFNRSPSKSTHSPSLNASTDDELPASPFQQPLQQQFEENLSKQLNSSIEDKPHHEEQCTSERDVGLVDEDSNSLDDQVSKRSFVATFENDDDDEDHPNNSLDHSSSVEYLDDCEDRQEDATPDSQPQEATKECLGEKGTERGETENRTSDEEEAYSYEKRPYDEKQIERSSSEDSRCEHVVSETVVESQTPWSDLEENDLTPGDVCEDEIDDASFEESRSSKRNNSVCEDDVDDASFEESQSSKIYNGSCDDVDDEGDEHSSIQDGDDPEYPKEDRELLSLLYHIHTH